MREITEFKETVLQKYPNAICKSLKGIIEGERWYILLEPTTDTNAITVRTFDNEYKAWEAAYNKVVYPIGGFAPGNYSCHCVICGKGFIGDKRAVQCEPCAIKSLQA